MVLNVLRISSSNVFKMSLNVIVSILYTFVNFYLHKPTGGTNARYQLPAHPGQRQESNAVIKKTFENKVVHAQNCRRCCTDYFHNFV